MFGLPLTDLYLYLIITILLMLLNRRPQPRNDWRIAQIERKIDLLLQQLNVNYIDESIEAVKSHLNRGQKVQAIKIFRKLNTGIDLVDAVKAVDAIERDLKR